MAERETSVADALGRGWRAFVARLGAFFLVAIIVAIIQWVLGILWAQWTLGRVGYEIQNFNDTTGGEISGGGFALVGVVVLLVSVLVTVASAAYYTSIALSGVDADGADASEINTRAMRNFGMFFGWTLLAGVCIAFGSVLCVIPGLVAIYFLMFVPYFAKEGGRGNPFAASGRVALRHPGSVVVLMLVGVGLIVAIGVIAWIVGAIFNTTQSAGQLVGAIVTWIVGFVAFGYYFCSIAAFYRQADTEAAAAGPGRGGS